MDKKEPEVKSPVYRLVWHGGSFQKLISPILSLPQRVSSLLKRHVFALQLLPQPSSSQLSMSTLISFMGCALNEAAFMIPGFQLEQNTASAP